MAEDLLQIVTKAYEDGYRYAEICITLMKGQKQLSQSSRGRLVAEANRIDSQYNILTNTIVSYNIATVPHFLFGYVHGIRNYFEENVPELKAVDIHQ